MTIPVKELWNMKTEFYEQYLKSINIEEKKALLARCHSLKLKAIKKMEKEMMPVAKSNTMKFESSDSHEQVVIEAKFVEVSDGTLEELGFQFNFVDGDEFSILGEDGFTLDDDLGRESSTFP